MPQHAIPAHFQSCFSLQIKRIDGDAQVPPKKVQSELGPPKMTGPPIKLEFQRSTLDFLEKLKLGLT